MRHAVAADLHRCVQVLVDAFDQDPVYRWMFPDEATFRAGLTEWFDFVGGVVFTRGHYYRNDDTTAVAIWIPPDVPLAPAADYAVAHGIVAGYSSEEHAARVFEGIGGRGTQRPDGPSWQLVYIGVAPAAQGKGAGSAIVAPMLEMCDREGIGAYLNSTNAKNVPFYERLGFTVLREVNIPDGPTIRPMWRAPRS